MRPISTRASRRRTLLAAIPITALLLGGAGAASASAATINVNPATGSSTNPGTPDKPLRTLEDALDRVKSGDTVRLAGGVYQERYKDPFGNPALLVPAGVTVQGEGNPALGRTVLSGGGATVGLHLLGGAKINDILLSNFDDGLQAAKGTSTLKGVDFSASTLQLAGDARVTYTADQPDPAATERGGAFTSLDGPAIRLRQGARLTMDGAFVGGKTPNCDLRKLGIDAGGSSSLNVTNLRMENLPGGAILAHEVTQATIATTNVTGSYPAGCTPAPAIDARDQAAGGIRDSQLSSNRAIGSVGIQVSAKFGFSTTRTSVTGWASGIKVAPGPIRVKVTGAQLRDNSFGLNAIGAPATPIDMTATRVEGNLTGIEAGLLTMRSSTVTSNLGSGLILDGTVADLGTIASAGANVLQGNGASGAVRVGSANTAGKVLAVGNTWEPGVQGADGAGHYLAHHREIGTSPLATGRNFRLPSSALASIDL